ncbi:TPA: hypothetical protein JG939_004213 [Enterobacter hormaechei subsp. xiangfangensis]|nr:hypothetical protein [Enterobacter hormaechei subsp. xiangfangensis]
MSESDKDILKYFDLLKSHELEFRKTVKQNSLSKLDNWIFYALISSVVISFLVIMVYYFLKPNARFLVTVSTIMILISYVLLLLMPVVKIYQERKSIKRFLMFPLSASVEGNIKKESIIDANFLPNFEALGKKALELGLMEIKHEREFLSKRVAMVVGPIDKLGILPGIISMIITISKPLEEHDWVTGLAYGYVALVIISISFINLLVKYDRIIALTELAISRCTQKI